MQGSAEGEAAGSWGRHLAAPPSSSDSRRRAPFRSRSRSDKPRKARKAAVAGFHPRQVVYHLDGRADSCKYLRNEQNASSFTLSALNFCQHLMTQFLPDNTKNVMTQEEMSCPQKWGLHICGPILLKRQVTFPDQLNSW